MLHLKPYVLKTPFVRFLEQASNLVDFTWASFLANVRYKGNSLQLARRSLTTTEFGHLRPQTQNQDFGSLATTGLHFHWQANKTSTVHAVTCDHTLGSLGPITITSHHGHRITCTHAGWVGWGGMITYFVLAHILADRITCTHALNLQLNLQLIF